MTTPTTREILINPMQVLLDTENIRNITGAKSQDRIRAYLLEEEDIVSVAESIAESGWDDIGEMPVVLEDDDGDIIVVEGNRRICALQMLRDRSLIPKEWRAHIPQPADDDFVSDTEWIAAHEITDRSEIDSFLGRRHMRAKRGVRHWSPQQIAGQILKLHKQGQKVDEISDQLSLSPATVKKRIFEAKVVEVVKNDKTLTTAEKSYLKGRIRPNALTRFFSIKPVNKVFDLKLDDKGKFKSSVLAHDREVNEVIRVLAKGLLFPQAGKKSPRFNTRTSTTDILLFAAGRSKIAKRCYDDWHATVAPAAQPTAAKGAKKTGARSAGKTAKGKASTPRRGKKAATPQTIPGIGPIDFYQGIHFTLTGAPVVAQILRELDGVRPDIQPVTCAVLQRALFECLLKWGIIKANLWNDLKREQKTADPKLYEMVKFCINNRKALFVHPPAANDYLKKLQKAREYWNTCSHGTQVPALSTLVDQARDLRPFAEELSGGRGFLHN